MNVIIVAKFLRAPRNFSLRDPKVVAVIAIFVLSILALGAGMHMLLSDTDDAAKARLAEMQERLDAQRQALAELRASSERDLNALAARLGELQAQANRLNALGERLTRIGQIADGEFDFLDVPGIGGAEPITPQSPLDVFQRIDELADQFEKSGEQLSVLESLLADRAVDVEATPAGMPVDSGYMSSHFGYRTDPITGGKQFHRGLDFSGNPGDPVKVVADGVVIFAGRDAGYGNVVDVDHGNGLMTRYAHNRQLLVRIGERVRAGQQIAAMGATGRATGTHLHFEVWRDGRPVNPRQFLSIGRR